MAVQVWRRTQVLTMKGAAPHPAMAVQSHGLHEDLHQPILLTSSLNKDLDKQTQGIYIVQIKP